MMVDPLAVVLTYLLTVESLTEYVGERIFADVDWPPKYDPGVGPAILMGIQPGGLYPDSDALAVPTIQYQVCANEPELAAEVARALYGALHNRSAKGIKLSTRETYHQRLPQQPDKGNWFIVFTAYRHWLVNS